MYYSEMVRKACNIMYEAHKNDEDKGGYPYVFHPFFLATQMEDEDSTCVALLHDVVEDHGDIYDFEKLAMEGFNSRIIHALKLLTHDKKIPYMDYVKKLSADSIARKVKLADLNHNMDSRRTNGSKPKKYEIYLEAVSYLENIEKKDL